MSGTRLFVGGVSDTLSEDLLRSELGSFGSIVKLDIKEKKDVSSGDVIKRFAFVTIESPSSRIDQCISSLHGKFLEGSYLTVERAQESFLEKLKREREAKAQGITPTAADDQPKSCNFSTSEEAYQRQTADNDRTERKRKRAPSDDEDNRVSWETRKNERRSDHNVQTATKTPDQIWRESVMEHNAEYETSRPKPEQPSYSRNAVQQVKPKVRFDPTTTTLEDSPSDDQPSKNATIVSENLTFAGASSSFSLLDMFSKVEEQKIAPKETEAPALLPEIEPSSTSAQNDFNSSQNNASINVTVIEPEPFVKKSKFFWDSNDSRIEENILFANRKPEQSRLRQFSQDRTKILSYLEETARIVRNTRTKEWTEKDSDGTVTKVLLVSDILKKTPWFFSGLQQEQEVVELATNDKPIKTKKPMRGAGNRTSRGRDGSSRGRDSSSRGKDGFSRGRDSSSRGRDGSSRGRNGQSRGRGDASRDRGESKDSSNMVNSSWVNRDHGNSRKRGSRSRGAKA